MNALEVYDFTEEFNARVIHLAEFCFYGSELSCDWNKENDALDTLDRMLFYSLTIRQRS